MSGWQLLEFDQIRSISPNDITSGCLSNPDLNICLSFPAKVELNASDDEAEKLLQTVQKHPHIISIFLRGKASSWLIAMALLSDLVFATADSSFSLTGLNGGALIATATAIGSRLPKSQAIHFFLQENHEAVELYRLGLLTEIVAETNAAEPLKYMRSFMNTAKEWAIIRLKEVWRNTPSVDKIDALTAERLEFEKCFKLGAAESIAAYLQNRFKANNK